MQIMVGSLEMTHDLIRAIDLHRAMPVIDSRSPLTNLKEALVHLEAGKHFGKSMTTF